jgi:hypothetical protein
MPSRCAAASTLVRALRRGWRPAAISIWRRSYRKSTPPIAKVGVVDLESFFLEGSLRARDTDQPAARRAGIRAWLEERTATSIARSTAKRPAPGEA